ncbi:MAG: GNAT family N-acetyltransferase [Desulfuromonadales bacterium]|nr:GNAT family N-acetyltransferase [Desulfuromonadales bacterium]
MEELTSRSWKKFIKNGYRIFLGTGASCPHTLIDLFLESAKHFNDLEFIYLLSLGKSPWIDPAYEANLRVNTFFLDQGTRDAVRSGKADYTPCFLSEIPALLKDNILPVDIAFIQVTPPDAQGYCSLGVSVDIVKSAAKSAKYILAQINDRMPRTFGQCYLHQDEIAAFIKVSEPLPEVAPAELDETALQIGKYVSLLIEDGCTLQVGIGKIPDAVLHQLTGHNDLGVHTEMFSDGLLQLYKNGNITNRLKGLHEGKTITSFCFGSRKLYEFVDNNPHVEFHGTDYVNNPAVIARNNQMISITSATQVDLTGQIVSDSVGGQFYSGIGGQVDFIRGAGMSRGGRPIIAMPSTACSGTVSRVVSVISQGAGVVATRGDVHYVVTEYGIATMRGRSIRERVMELIQIAHPKFREQLLEDMLQSSKVPTYQRSTPVPVKELGTTEVIKLDMQGEDYFLRPLHPSDQLRLQSFFYSHDKVTLFQRYRNEPKKMGTAQAYRLVNTDLTKDMALCIFERQGPREVILAVGRYYTLEDRTRAEVAFVVHESMRGRGFASLLLEKLIDIARQRRLKFLTANVRKDNPSMRRVFEKYHFTSVPAEDPSELEYLLSLEAS